MQLTARLVGIAVLAAGLASLAWAADPPAKLELRRAETKAAEGLTEAKVVGTDQKVYLHKEAELTDKDIAQARVVEDKQVIGPMIEIVFTKEGQAKIGKLTGEHLDKPLAILFEGKVIAAPVVRAKLDGEKALFTGNFTKEEAEKIASSIKGK
jgi:preprotein translocase subunit SecD